MKNDYGVIYHPLKERLLSVCNAYEDSSPDAEIVLLKLQA